MENVRIAIISTHDNVCAFMDNEAVDGLHYWDDELHQYLSGSSHTFSFKADAQHEDSVYLTVGNKISFQYHKKDYYLNIVNCIRSEDVVEVEAYALNFELLNEYVSAYAASSAMSFEEYLNVFDYEKTVQLGINEVSDKSIKHEWTGTDTILGRLFSLANVFDAEIEFVTRLNQDYSLGAVIMNVYKEHSDFEQGIGRNRTDITLRYGVEVEGVIKTSDMTDLYTAIRPTGTDGLTLKELEKTELDEDGNVEYQLRKGDGTICAVQARDRFPSNLMGKRSDGYIVYYWNYETSNVNMLYGQALAQLKKNCVPQVSYDVKGYFNLEIGDTVIVCDEEYTPELYLSVRVVEQSVSFTDPSKNKTTVGNVKELQSEIDAELLAKVQELASTISDINNRMDQIAEEVTTSLYISSSKGNVFKNTNVSTYLSITIIRGTQRITDSQTMKSVFGENAYLQWRYQGKDDEDFWNIPQEDPRILENGFKFKVSPSDIYTKGVYTCDLIS